MFSAAPSVLATLQLPSLLGAGWLANPYVFWILVSLATLLTLAIGGCVIAKRRATLIALLRHPNAKYVILSVVAHVMLGGWLLKSHVLEPVEMGSGPAVVTVDIGSEESHDYQQSEQPWDHPETQVADAPVPELPPDEPQLPDVEKPLEDPIAEPAPSPLETMASIVEPPVEGVPAEAPSPFEAPPVAISPPVELEPKPEPEEPAPQEAVAELKTPEPIAAPTFSNETPQQQSQLAELPNTTDDASAISSKFDNPFETAKPEPTPQPESASEPNQTMTTAAPQNPVKLKASVHNVSSSQSLQPRNAPSQSASVPRRIDGREVPAIYRDRWADNRIAIARQRGGSEEAEAAVRAALVWLAKNQAADGRWDASQFGSGQPVRFDNHNRGQAGLNADTATTGLALLAFLGSGHTHTQGEYSEVMERGLAYLLQAQRNRTDGSLVGSASGYAAMYCHGIATLAISEAHALTGDPELLEPVKRALNFTLAAQHPSGGWRYRPQQAGDTSQLGWQLMALTSAHYGGHRIPNSTWARASSFLKSVEWGSYGGKASYTPNSRPSRTMTAEATLCRLFLNTSPDHPKISEGANHLMEELPGQSRLNYYYWYYGTLSLYHLQNEQWGRWNRAVTRELTQRQNSDGSWPVANSVWGQAGGKVYTTALAAMTLEVYYRYRPLSEKRAVEHTARRGGR